MASPSAGTAHALHDLQPAQPVDAVLFDFHTTLVDQGDAHDWLERAWTRAGRPGTAREGFGPDRHEALAGWLQRIWEHASRFDPKNERDLSPVRHRQVFDALVGSQAELPDDVRDALYAAQFDLWCAYDDAVPALEALRARGKKLALISNIGVDLAPILARNGMGALFDAVLLSWQVGAVKPSPDIFRRALEALGTPAGRALMVGDNLRDDGAAALLGIRTLILPRTTGRVHGLDLVVRAAG